MDHSTPLKDSFNRSPASEAQSLGQPFYEGSRQRDFLRGVELRRVAWHDEQEARALELDEMGEPKRARRVRECGNPSGRYLLTRYCGDRTCPGCSQYKSSVRAKKMIVALGCMRSKVFCTALLVTTTNDERALREGITQLRRLLGRLRRRKVFRFVLGGYGGLEVPRTPDGQGWRIHAHLVLDVPPELFDVPAVEAAWKDLTDGRGEFWVDEEEEVEDDASVAFYVFKTLTTSPPPGDTSRSAFAALVGGLRGKRLVIAWGSGKVPPSQSGGAQSVHPTAHEAHG